MVTKRKYQTVFLLIILFYYLWTGTDKLQEQAAERELKYEVHPADGTH